MLAGDYNVIPHARDVHDPQAWAGDVKRSYCLICGDEKTFGPLFWILISPILQHILTRLIEWWFDRPSHRVIMTGWKRELTQ